MVHTLAAEYRCEDARDTTERETDFGTCTSGDVDRCCAHVHVVRVQEGDTCPLDSESHSPDGDGSKDQPINTSTQPREHPDVAVVAGESAGGRRLSQESE